MKKLFTVYRSTNQITGKIYVGVHKTSNPYDSYLGSGKVLHQSIRKHGKHAFTKEILLITEDRTAAYALEKEIVTQEFIEDPLTYNQKVGGDGGWDFVHAARLTNKNKTAEHYAKMGKIGNEKFQQLRKDPAYNAEWIKKVTHAQSSETRDKISKSLTGRKRNRCWINNGETNIYHSTLTEIPEGYVVGKKKS